MRRYPRLPSLDKREQAEGTHRQALRLQEVVLRKEHPENLNEHGRLEEF
jgi:hypothetical protein